MTSFINGGCEEGADANNGAVLDCKCFCRVCAVPLPCDSLIPIFCTDAGPDNEECGDLVGVGFSFAEAVTSEPCVEPDLTDEEKATACRDKCEQDFAEINPDAPDGVECRLADVFGNTEGDEATPGVRFLDSCNPSNSAVGSEFSATWASVDPGASNVTIHHSIGGDGSTTGTGRVFFSGGICKTGPCPLTFTLVELLVDDFFLCIEDLGCAPVRAVTILSDEAFTADHVSGQSYLVASGSSAFFVNGLVFGISAGITFEPTQPIAVTLDLDARRVAVSGVFASNGDTMVLDIEATINNAQPIADAGGDRVVECSARGGAAVALDAMGSVDPDGPGDLHDAVWWSGPGEFAALGLQTTIGMSVGTRRDLVLQVFDSSGATSRDAFSVEVVDTTPPSLTDFAYEGPVCLWPPSHDYAILSVGREFTGIVSDVCDPLADLRITGATSSQPDDAEGDGNTLNDVVVFPDHVCLRAERQGTVLEGRQYSVQLHAVDASGNSSDPTIELVVGHDQRPGQRCVDGVEYVPADDPRCIPPRPAAAVDTQIGDRVVGGGGGCAASGTPAVLWALVLMVIACRKRA
ncbi:MAG: hypothetical protein HYS27_17110 [Deltaproteobacteria bacterium]|nr:hypothetical protein [Deltaproteobacteria bacterium]